MHNDANTMLFGKDKYLDGLVLKKKIDVALTVFGPSLWELRCPHLYGFAMVFHVIPESPYDER